MSQFTLYGILKGNEPDFHVAMSPERAKPFYASLVDKFRRSYNPDAVKGKSFLFRDDFLIRFFQSAVQQSMLNSVPVIFFVLL